MLPFCNVGFDMSFMKDLLLLTITGLVQQEQSTDDTLVIVCLQNSHFKHQLLL
jgi:hypothetical protein